MSNEMLLADHAAESPACVIHRLAVLLSCHNRRQATLRCLDSLAKQHLPQNLHMSVYLVDDGCTDGTVAAVRRLYPDVAILPGDGRLFWCGGMRKAFAEASKHNFDFYLWLNDDTVLAKEAIERLLSVYGEGGARSARDIVVGSTADPDSGQASYGGVVRRCAWHPFRFTLVRPTDYPQPCDTMNGNCVLVPRSVAKEVGNFDPAFGHGFGDFDYGLRARRAGFGIMVAPGIVGTCSRNMRRLPWRDPSLTWRQRWVSVTGKKGLPPREMFVYARRHGGLFWPVFWCIPYLRALLFPTRRPVTPGKPL